MPGVINMVPSGSGLPAASSPISNGVALTATGQPPVSPDELSQLYPMQLSDNVAGSQAYMFPTIVFREQFTKDLIHHKFINRDGAFIENMGSNPEKWQIRAIFTNNIDPSPLPLSYRGLLFPFIFQQVIDLLKTPGDKLMQHPLYGNQLVQIEGFDYELIASGPRDGAYLNINVVRTNANSGTGSTVNKPIQILSAGRNVNNAMLQGDTLGIPTPPGLSLTQFFGRIASLVQNITQFPNDVVSSVNDTTLALTATTNVFSSLNQNLGLSANVSINPLTFSAGAGISLSSGTNLVSAGINSTYSTSSDASSAVAYLITQQNTAVVAQKQAPLGSPLNPYQSSNQETVPSNSSVVVQQAYSFNEVAQKATKSLLSLNQNPSPNATVFLDKSIRATYDLLQYYIGLNLSSASYIIFTLQQMMGGLQQAQTNLNGITTLNSVRTNNYITKTNVSWLQLSSLLNTPLVDLMNLNPIPNVNYMFIPANTLVKYYQQAG